MDHLKIANILHQTQTLRTPKRRLATFGDTHIQYHLLSTLESLPNRCRLREGSVLAQRPKILTWDAFQKRFSGFGEDSDEFARWLTENYRDILRVLEYNFKNQMANTQVLQENPRRAAEKIRKDLDERDISQAAVLLCPDSGWQLSLMKFILDETKRSFPVHVREMEEHDLFNPGAREDHKKRYEIEQLLKAAARDKSLIKLLGEKLKAHGLFEEYEDRFYSLLS